MGALVAVLLASLLAGCASGRLSHAVSGDLHVFLGPPLAIDRACRDAGLTDPERIVGCYLRAGATEVMWLSDDADLADTIAHEWRHSQEGRWHR